MTAFEKLARSVRIEQGSKSSTATIELDPPELGHIRVEARMSGEALELSIRAESAAARHLLGERLGELRHALEQHGVRTGAFELSPWSPEDSGSNVATGGFSDARQAFTAHPEVVNEPPAESGAASAAAPGKTSEGMTGESLSGWTGERLDVRA